MNKTPEQQKQDQDTRDAFEMAMKGHKQFEYQHRHIWLKTDSVDSGFPHRIFHTIPEGWTRHDGGEWTEEKDVVFEEVMLFDGRKQNGGTHISFWIEGVFNSFTTPDYTRRIYAYKLKLTPALPTIPEGFTRWEGGKCPVAETVMLDIAFADGSIERGVDGCWNWKHTLKERNIIAYRIITPTIIPWIDRVRASNSFAELRNLLIEKFDIDNQSV